MSASPTTPPARNPARTYPSTPFPATEDLLKALETLDISEDERSNTGGRFVLQLPSASELCQRRPKALSSLASQPRSINADRPRVINYILELTTPAPPPPSRAAIRQARFPLRPTLTFSRIAQIWDIDFDFELEHVCSGTIFARRVCNSKNSDDEIRQLNRRLFWQIAHEAADAQGPFANIPVVFREPEYSAKSPTHNPTVEVSPRAVLEGKALDEWF